MVPPTAFVAGATGFTGRALVPLLVARGVRTLAHVRPDSPQLASWRARFERLGAEVDTTPWLPDTLRARLSALAPTHVFCLVGTTRQRARRPTGSAIEESYTAVDQGLTVMLVDACRGVQPPPRFVLLSALGTGPTARGTYYQARWRAEQAVRESGLPHVIVRAPLISGPDRDDARPLERMAAEAARISLTLARALGGRGLAERYAPIAPDGLGQALVRWAFSPEADNLTLGPEALR